MTDRSNSPAVTLCLTLVGECSLLRCGAYIAAQLLGAVFGSLLVWACTSNMSYGRQEEVESLVGNPPFDLGANGLNATLNAGNGFVLEFLGTFLLCITVLSTVLHPDNLAQGKPANAPIAIGFAVFLSHVVLIPLTGCGINPARTFGPALVNSMAGNNVWASTYWIYFVGPFMASFAAAGLHKTLLHPNEPAAVPKTAVQQDTSGRPLMMAKV
ncbi:Aquaporin [Hondaea fermentalgiana]|uniref:Aquaporin n=1 Tax=Hondaea fermentalgiana TaxID=2315210 RepID=A0A2R5GHG7_9STRA|nr:Aquaporin [Hondaea fermentalgiana]|eukprot:GBG30035.1 Aquaporin [Hondaea fermentalgiana]